MNKVRDSIQVGFLSLGCAKNLVDTEKWMNELADRGCVLCADLSKADVLVVNTCGFISSAAEESRETLREVVKLKRQGVAKKVIGFGCFVSRGTEDLLQTVPGLDCAVPLDEPERLLNEIVGIREAPGRSVRRIAAAPTHSAYLKIAEGCSRKCTYCTIPAIRGPNKDRDFDELIKESGELTGRGAKEIVVIAQDTTAYGLERYGKSRLAELLKKMNDIPGLEWIRLMYAYPDNMTEELTDLLLDDNMVVPYLDLPIQHASPSVLRRMARAGSRERFDRVFDCLRNANPDFCLRTTVIVGFPGETEGEFEELLEYVRMREFDRLGAFPYSNEQGTPASKIKGQLDPAVIRSRFERIMELQAQIHRKRNERFVGKKLRVLLEEGGEEAYGRSFREAPEQDGFILIENNPGNHPGDMITVELTGLEDYDLTGRKCGG